MNASLAFIEGAKPRDEIECALVIQMACTHSAAMAVLNRLGGAAGNRGSTATAYAWACWRARATVARHHRAAPALDRGSPGAHSIGGMVRTQVMMASTSAAVILL